jgi:hypothetical protein
MKLQFGTDREYIASSCRIGCLAGWWPGHQYLYKTEYQRTYSFDNVSVWGNGALEELVKCLNVVGL